MKTRAILIYVIVLILAAGLFPAAASAQNPALPMYLYGEVSIEGNPAPIGTRIEARGENVKSYINNPLITQETGKYGEPLAGKLTVQGTNLTNGTIIEFFVNGVKVDESIEFESGAILEFDLNSTRAASSPAVSSSNSSVYSGEVVNFAAQINVEFGNPTGTVIFKDGNIEIGAVQLDDRTASLSVSNLTVGTHTVTAFYTGDVSFSSSSGSVIQIIRPRSSGGGPGGSGGGQPTTTIPVTTTAAPTTAAPTVPSSTTPAVSSGTTPAPPVSTTTPATNIYSAPGKAGWQPAANGTVPGSVMLSSLNNDFSLSISGGTQVLDSQGKAVTEITCSEIKEFPSNPPDGKLVLVYDLTPVGTNLNPAGIVFCKFDPSLPSSRLSLMSYDNTAGKWVTLQNISVNPGNHTITGQIKQLSRIGLVLLAEPSAPALTTSGSTAPVEILTPVSESVRTTANWGLIGIIIAVVLIAAVVVVWWILKKRPGQKQT